MSIAGGQRFFAMAKRNFKRSKKVESKCNDSTDFLRFERTVISRGELKNRIRDIYTNVFAKKAALRRDPNSALVDRLLSHEINKVSTQGFQFSQAASAVQVKVFSYDLDQYTIQPDNRIPGAEAPPVDTMMFTRTFRVSFKSQL